MRVLIGRLSIMARNPDVTMTVPAVIALLPNPAAMLEGWRRNTLNRARRRWADAYNHLCSGGKGCGQHKTTDDRK
jgi:hypothetical protein